jgi:hypothetical protein
MIRWMQLSWVTRVVAGQLGHLEVAVQDPPERRVALRGLVALGLLQQPAQCLKRARIVGAVSRSCRGLPVTGSVPT